MPRDAHPNSAAARACCTQCPKRGVGVVLRTRIQENLDVERERLCDNCARRGGWARCFDPIGRVAA